MTSQYTQGTINTAKNLRIIDDALFRLIAERREACQEILRTLLGDKNLDVCTSTPQYEFSEFHRTITVDCLCKLSDGTLCNIEMQKSDANDDLRRCRFHASIITTNKTPKKMAFKDILNVKVLYITEYDALNNGQAVTLVKRCQNLGSVFSPVDDGEEIYFANTAVKDGSEGSRLLQLFLKRDAFYDEAYPALSKAMEYFKNDKEGQNKMCKAVEEYAKEYAEEYAKEYAKEYAEEYRISDYVSLVKEGLLTSEVAAARLNMSMSEFVRLIDEPTE